MSTQAFGNYQLVKKLATGGMAEVWLSKQIGIEGFNRHVVVKRILPHLSEDPEFVQMFLNEAKIASRFNHPNIAQIFDLGQTDGQYFIAMEFIHGEDLGRLMRKAWSTGQWIARPLAIRIVAEACKGLHYAHTRKDDSGRPLQVVHRDISPQNILISFDGSVKLVDFGIAKAADQASMTKSGAIKGKFAYMAPEQAGGRPLDARTDLFALGLVLYELLTGVRPLKRDSELATLQAALECAIEPPSVVAEVPGELDDVVMRALARAPDDRYRDSSQFQMALEEFLISQRLVATSVQIAELMETLFAERRAEEARIGAPNPQSQESMQSIPAAAEQPSQSHSAQSSTGRSQSQSRRQEESSWPVEPSHTDAARPGEAGRSGGGSGSRNRPPEVEEWEAPPAPQVVPSRRYNNNGAPNNGQSTAFARGNPPGGSGTSAENPVANREETRARPLTAEVPAPVERRRPPPSKRNGAAAPRIVEDEVEPPPEPEPLDEPALATPARRTSSGARATSGGLRRTSSSQEMPEAPARRSRPSLEVVKPGKKKRDSDPGMRRSGTRDALAKADDELAAIKASQAKSRKLVLGVGAVVVVGVLGFVFKDALLGMFKPQADDGVPIILSVDTNPTTTVNIVHQQRSGKKRPDDNLGPTPIDKAKGVFVGDTVQLLNEENCISDEQTIQFGQPWEERPILKTYRTGGLKLKVEPPMRGLAVYCFGRSVGQVGGMGIKLYEGTHKLELRGETLSEPVPFTVTIEPGKDTPITVPIGDASKRRGNQ